MDQALILLPALTLASWTMFILLLILATRVRAGIKNEIFMDDFKFGESSNVPNYIRIVNKNYINLLELPTIFYLTSLSCYVTESATSLSLSLACAYVVLRIIHSLIHITYNSVLHRLIAFGSSNIILGVILALLIYSILIQSNIT